MNTVAIASGLIGVAIALPILARNIPKLDKDEVFTRTGVRFVSEEDKSLLSLQISRAGLDIQPEYFMGLKVCLTSLYLIAVVALSFFSPLFLVLALMAPVIYLLPSIWLKNKINKRKAEFKKRLDDFAMYLSTALNSVPDIAEALKEAGKATGGVYEEEIDLVILKTSSGDNLMYALADMSSRADVDELNTLISSINQIYTHGASASDKMQEFSDKVRESKRFDIMDQASRTQIKLILVVLLFILVPILMVIGYPAVHALIQVL